MTKDEALAYFETDADFQQIELLDAMDERLFHLKNEVLQKINVPSLLHKRKKECERMTEALTALNMKEEIATPEFGSSHLPSDTIGFLETYESRISSAKLIVFHAKSPQELAKAIDFLMTLQEEYISLFCHVFEVFGPFTANEKISVQTPFESGVVLRGLKNNESGIQELIRNEASRILKLQSLK